MACASSGVASEHGHAMEAFLLLAFLVSWNLDLLSSCIKGTDVLCLTRSHCDQVLLKQGHDLSVVPVITMTPPHGATNDHRTGRTGPQGAKF